MESIRRHCSHYRIYVLADCNSEDFPKSQIRGEDIEIIYTKQPSGGHWGKIWQMQNEGMTKALERDDLSEDCIFVRIDADAMVIRRGLVERAKKIFAENPTCGQLGQCHFNISGKPLENKGWANYFKKRTTFIGLLKAFLLLHLQRVELKQSIKMIFRLKYLLKSAFDNDYKAGEFALGPSILRLDAVKKLYQGGWLINSPFRWFPNVQDDVLITLHIYAVGYKAYDDTQENGIFAICGEELWIHPHELLNKGCYIIHPVKYWPFAHFGYETLFNSP
jgi:hypothetical protein